LFWTATELIASPMFGTPTNHSIQGGDCGNTLSLS
jgi:hypothetical protein